MKAGWSEADSSSILAVTVVDLVEASPLRLVVVAAAVVVNSNASNQIGFQFGLVPVEQTTLVVVVAVVDWTAMTEIRLVSCWEETPHDFASHAGSGPVSRHSSAC